MGKHHPGHPAHKLELTNAKTLYRCDGCKEPGTGSSHRCEDCDYGLHEDCMFYKSTTTHDFFPKYTFKYLLKPPHSHVRYCAACAKRVRGFVYRCDERSLYLHPCCMKLPHKIKADDVPLRLHSRASKERCPWCEKRSPEVSVSETGIRGWSYMSKCGQYHFHVNCFANRMHKELKELENASHRDKSRKNDNDHYGLALALKNSKLPLQARSGNSWKGKKKWIWIAKVFFKTLVGVLLGDPISLPLAFLEFIKG